MTDKTVAELMALARECGDIERRHCIGKAAGFDVRNAYANLEQAIRRAVDSSLEAAKQEPLTDEQIDEVMRAVDLPAIRNKDFRAERDQVMTLPEYNEYAAQVAFARAVIAAAPSPGSWT